MNNSIKHLILNNTFFWSLIIFITASLFRLTNLGLMEFKFDEAFNVFQLSSFYNQPVLTFHSGLSSSGIYNFPLLHYILIIIGVFSRDPIYLTFVIALINVILCVYFFLGIKKYYGILPSAFSALLIAASPWAILYSRKIWHPDLLLLFVIPVIILLHRLIIDHKQQAVFWIFLLLALAGQQHFSGFALLIAVLIAFFILKVKYSYKKALLGYLVGLIPALPYILNGLIAIPSMYQISTNNFDLLNFVRPLQIVNGLFFEDGLGADFNLFLQTYPLVKYLNYFFYLQFIIPLFGIFYILKQKKEYKFLLYIPLIILVGYLLTQTPARMYYFIVLLPFMVIIYSLSIVYLFSKLKSIFFKLLIIFLAALLILGNLIFEYSFINFIQTKQNIHGNYGKVYYLTNAYLEEQLIFYKQSSDFDKLKAYSYLFADPKFLHIKLAEYFINNNNPEFAEIELKKALDFNENDSVSRANLIYLQLHLKKNNEALLNYKILENIDSTLSLKFKNNFNNESK